MTQISENDAPKSIKKFVSRYPESTRKQYIARAQQHYKSDDRKIRYYYEDKQEEFRQFLFEPHYGARTIKAYLGRVAGLFSNNRLDLLLDKSFWARAQMFKYK